MTGRVHDDDDDDDGGDDDDDDDDGPIAITCMYGTYTHVPRYLRIRSGFPA